MLTCVVFNQTKGSSGISVLLLHAGFLLFRNWGRLISHGTRQWVHQKEESITHHHIPWSLNTCWGGRPASHWPLHLARSQIMLTPHTEHVACAHPAFGVFHSLSHLVLLSTPLHWCCWPSVQLKKLRTRDFRSLFSGPPAGDGRARTETDWFPIQPELFLDHGGSTCSDKSPHRDLGISYQAAAPVLRFPVINCLPALRARLYPSCSVSCSGASVWPQTRWP